MVTAIRQKAVVGKDGRIELLETDLKEGTAVEVIILEEPEDETAYLLKSEANRKHLLEALANVKGGRVVNVNLDEYTINE